MSDSRPLAVFDIDGVVADVRHRLHFLESKPKSWDAFFAAASEDPVLQVGADRVRALAVDHDIVYVTGRPARCRSQTQDWLERAGIGGWPVVMRRNGDRRPARLTKVHEVRTLAKRAQVGVVVDDDPEVCAEMTQAGFTVELATWMNRSESLRDAQGRQGRT